MKVTPVRMITLGFVLILLLPTLGQSVIAGPSESRIQEVLTNSADAYATPSGDGVQVATYRVTLITGDLVIVTLFPDGRKSFAVQPVNPGEEFASFTQGNHTYVVPSSARLDNLDMNLFDVDYLLREKYYQLSYLPLLVTGTSKTAIQTLVASQSLLSSITRTFKILPAFAAQPKMSDIRNLYETLVGRPETAKIWLDRVNHASLNESVPLIEAPSVWSMGYDGTGVRIAILDTGIDATHPDVSGKIDSAVDMTDDGTTDDLYGHGTHVAIIAAGTGKASDGKFKGVAPGASLMNVKVLNRYGWGYDSWIISGIEYATNHGGNIVSMSLGGAPTDGSDPLSQAVDAAVAKGVVVAVAAGNSGSYFTVGTPGAARQAITVGASDKLDTLAYFSSRGPTVDFRVKPDILAPGVNIISGHAAHCISSYVCSYIPNPPGQPPSGPPNYPPFYNSLSGTSMATPHVSGLIALMKQANAAWTPAFIKDALINTALQLDGYDIYEQGGGRIQAPDAVQTTMLMDPGSYSFGVLSAPPVAAAYSDFSVYNLGGSAFDVSLSVTLVDIQSGSSYSSAATMNVTSLSVSGSSSKGIRLTIDLTSLPTSVYSGLICATRTDGKTIHSVFGFAKLRTVKVTKLNRQGTTASGDYLYAWKTDASSWFDLMLNFRSALADTGGHATFFLGDGVYTFASFDSDETGMTIAENVDVSSQVDLNLDERNNMRISFDPAIPDQKIFQVRFRLSFEIPIPGGTPYGSNTHFVDFLYASNTYPSSSDMFVGSTSAHALFNYQYFPGSAYNPADPDFIAATSWGDLQYYIHGISEPIVWVADYSQIVVKSTQYSAKLNPSARTLNMMLWPYNKAWFDSQRNLGRPFWMDMQSNYYTFLPQARTEFLSPDTYYSEMVTLNQIWPPPGAWVTLQSPLPVGLYGLYEVRETWPGRVWEPGESFAETWNGIFSSQLNLVVDSPYSTSMIGSLFMDSYLHAFGDNAGEVTGKLTVRKEGYSFSTDLYNYPFSLTVPIDGFGSYIVNIHGTQGCEPLSTETDANYTLSIQSNGLLLPPLIEFRSSQIDLYNTATGGSGSPPVQIDLRVDTPSSIVTDVTLNYSMDDGASWNPVQVVATGDPREFVADLPLSAPGYVSLWATARDGNGNTVSQIVKRAFAVRPPPPYMARITAITVVPDPSNVGQSSKMVYTITVQNTGINDISSAKVQVKVYKPGGTTAVSSPYRSITSFKAGTARTVNVTYTLSSSAPLGYWIYSVNVYRGSTLLDQVADQGFTVQPPVKTGEILSVTANPDPVGQGGATAFTVVFKNTGNIIWSTAKLTAKIYKPDSTTVYATRTLTVSKIAPNVEYSYQVKWKPSSSAALGTYTYDIHLTYRSVGLDSSIGNTVKVAPIVKTGEITFVTDAPDPVTRGETATFTLVVKNTGNTIWSSGKVKVKIYKPDGTTLYTTKSLSISNLMPGVEYTYNVKWTVSSYATTGTYRYDVYFYYGASTLMDSDEGNPSNTITIN